MPLPHIQFHQFIDGSALYTCILLDREGNYHYYNERFRTLVGLEAQQTVPLPLVDSKIHYGDEAFFRKRIQQCFDQPEEKTKATIRYITNGSNITIQWELGLTMVNDQPMVGGVGFLLSGGPLLEFTAARYVHQFNEYLDAVNNGFFALNRNLEFMQVNKFFAQVSGLDKKDIIGKKFWDLLPMDDTQPYSEAMKKALETNQTITFEQPWPPDYHFAVSVTPSREGIVCYFIDISIQKKQQLELLRNEIKLKAILESTTDANVLITSDLRLANFNRTARMFTKQFMDFDLTIGCKPSDCMSQELLSAFYTNFHKALAGEQVLIERPFASLNGDVEWFELLYYPVYNEAGKSLGVALNITNINARKIAEMKLLQQYDKMREIAYLQSHEARAPLSNILGLINVLVMSNEKNADPEMKEMLEYLRSSAEKLDSVIQKIVSNTRYD